ncbi:MAG: hypothetical protein ACI30R_09775 [Sodaliphilus sp.]
MKFCDDSENDKYQYLLFSQNFNSLDIEKADYLKIKKNRNAEFSITFFNDSIGKTIIHFPDNDIIGSRIVEVHQNQFEIDTISAENNRFFTYNSQSGYYEWNVESYSTMLSLQGFVLLSHNKSKFTPLCAVRPSLLVCVDER